jgi:hypothetical protein
MRALKQDEKIANSNSQLTFGGAGTAFRRNRCRYDGRHRLAAALGACALVC